VIPITHQAQAYAESDSKSHGGRLEEA